MSGAEGGYLKTAPQCLRITAAVELSPSWKQNQRIFGGCCSLVRFPPNIKKEPPNLYSTGNVDSLFHRELSDVVK